MVLPQYHSLLALTGQIDGAGAHALLLNSEGDDGKTRIALRENGQLLLGDNVTDNGGKISLTGSTGSANFTNTDAGKQFRLCQTLGDTQYMWATREADGLISSYLTPNGSATFAGKVTAADYDLEILPPLSTAP